MHTLPTMARKSWVEQISIIAAGCLCTIGGLSLLGWWLPSSLLLQPLAGLPAVMPNEALCILLLGSGMLGIELSMRRTALLGLPSGILALLTLYQYLPGGNLGIDQLLAKASGDFLFDVKAEPGRMAAITAGCLTLASILLVWRSLRRNERFQLFANAIVGSLISAIGLSTFLGYVLNLEEVYRWGFATAVSPGSALALFATGSCFLSAAWRESSKTQGGPPVWAPMPAILASLTLSVIFWIAMREREDRYLNYTTQTELNSFASHAVTKWSTLLTTLDAKFRGLQDLAPEALETSLEKTALEFVSGNKDLGYYYQYGIYGVHLIDAGRTVLNHYSAGNGISYRIAERPLEEARRTPLGKIKNFLERSDKDRGQSLITVTAPFTPTFAPPPGRSDRDASFGKYVFSIYLPLYRNNVLSAIVAVDVDADQFYGALEQNRASRASFDFFVRQDMAVVYGAELIERASAHPLFQSKSFTIPDIQSLKDVQLQFGIVPTYEFLKDNKRFLPELTLFAGLGITLLVGLSIHFARNARASLMVAEKSIRQLHAENEERRRVEERLKSSDERLRLALDSTGIGIFEWNVPTGYVYYSQGLWITLGYEPSRMTATVDALQSLVHPEDFAAYRRRIEAQLTGTTPFIDPEFRVRAHNGEWRWVYVRSRTVGTGQNHLPIRILGTLQDITSRREAEEALRASQAATRKLSMVAARTDNLVVIFSPDGRVEWVNESFTRATEFQLTEIAGKRLIEFLAGPDTDARAIGRIRNALSQGQAISTDIVQYTKTHKKFHLSYDIQPIRNKSTEIENFIAVATDITARVETEQALRRAKSEADAASRAKSEFLASMSHEIRTPMNGVIGMTSLLLETKLDDDQREYVNTIRNSGEALLTIINDILDFSKIESGKMELERLPFDLGSAIEESLELFVVQAAAKKLELVYHVERGVPATILGDVTRLRQVLVNLINNAVKFTPGGSISITARLAPGDPSELGVPPGRLLLEFSVRDSGIGIPPDRLNRLFKVFSQVDSSTTRKYGGTGLGLAICQRLCALMGGEIRVESEQGKGSNFVFTIQTEAVPQTSQEELPALPPALRNGEKVLIVEDHPVTQQRLVDLFRSWGADILVADNAPQAQRLLQEYPRPGLLVLDFDDTDLDRFFSHYRAVAAPRLIMVPFGSVPPDTTNDRHAYMFIAKPIRSGGLYQAVASLFASVVRQDAAAAATPSAPVLGEEIPLDILLVEDNLVNQKVALRFLDRLGYRANAAGNGLEAINALEARRYHLVLMDLQMPEMDGLEASRQIRKRFATEQQPKIIALTANALQGDRELCIEAGMDDYITKPVKITEIEAAIRRQFPAASRS